MGTKVIGAIVLGIAAIIGVTVALFPSYYQADKRVVQVCDKESVSTGSDNGHEYRVYTSDGTFVVEDHVLHGVSFRSSELYGHLQAGKVYEFEFYGFRVPFTSTFETLISATPSTAAPSGTCD